MRLIPPIPVLSSAVLAIASLLSTGACTDPDALRAGADASRVVDSVLPRDTALARFRAGLEPVAALRGGAASRDALVRAFVTYLQAGDAVALASLAISRAEFAWLYYPTVPEAYPPYDLSPGLMWFMLEGNSGKGLRRALEEYGGEKRAFVGLRCDGEPRIHGANRVHPLCLVRSVRTPGDTAETRLFGPILERDGRFKFVSLANTL